MQLAPYQARCLREALRRDEKGDFIYSTIVWSDIKKSIKSCIAAAVAEWVAFNTAWGNIYLIANDLQQADSRVGYYARRAVELNPDMREIVRVKPSGYYMEFPNKTFIRAIPIDPTGEAGANPDMVQFDELWGAHEDAKRRMWVELTVPPNKFGKSFRWVSTYAGFNGESRLLEDLYEQGVKGGRQLWPDELYDVTGGNPTPVEAYSNEAARQFTLWNTQPRLSWQIPEYYAQERAVMDDSEFNRVHRNQWAQAKSEAIPIEMWDACREDIVPIMPGDRTPIVVGLDASDTHDSTALVGVSRHPTRHGDVAVRLSRVFVPTKGKPIDFDTTIGETLEEWKKNFVIIQVAFDYWQMVYFSKQTSKKMSLWFKAFNQGVDRQKSDAQLYELVTQHRIAHDGNKELREAITNAVAVKNPTTGAMRFDKKSASTRIDALIALSMASAECLRLAL